MKKVFIVLIIISLSYCNIDNCSDKIGFKLDYYLFDHIEVNGKSYCDLVNGALKGKKESVLELSKINIGDGASYEHGAVLIEVIDKLTELEYLKIINPLDVKERKAIYSSYVWAGLEFTRNPKYQKKRIEIAFPELTTMFQTPRNRK